MWKGGCGSLWMRARERICGRKLRGGWAEGREQKRITEDTEKKREHREGVRLQAADEGAFVICETKARG